MPGAHVVPGAWPSFQPAELPKPASFPVELLTSAATVNQWRFEQRSMHAGVREEVEGVVVKLRKASRTVGSHGSGIPVSLTLVLMMMLPVCW